MLLAAELEDPVAVLQPVIVGLPLLSFTTAINRFPAVGVEAYVAETLETTLELFASCPVNREIAINYCLNQIL